MIEDIDERNSKELHEEQQLNKGLDLQTLTNVNGNFKIYDTNFDIINRTSNMGGLIITKHLRQEVGGTISEERGGSVKNTGLQNSKIFNFQNIHSTQTPNALQLKLLQKLQTIHNSNSNNTNTPQPDVEKNNEKNSTPGQNHQQDKSNPESESKQIVSRNNFNQSNTQVSQFSIKSVGNYSNMLMRKRGSIQKERRASTNPNPLPNFHNSKISGKSYGCVAAFAANTNVGIPTKFKESVHSVNFTEWPQIQIFGIYDGHGGVQCADYLKENLHNKIVRNSKFQTDIIQAIQEGAEECDREFLNKVNDDFQRTIQISNLPREQVQVNRAGSIIANGGKIYQSSTVFQNGQPTTQIKQDIIETLTIQSEKEKNNPYVGPYRVFPGKLSVTRTFGDIEAKFAEFGGKEGIVVSEPDITEIKNGGDEVDFILIGSDGVFDKLTNEEISDICWAQIRQYESDQNISVHQICGKIADQILIQCGINQSLDNVSVVFVAFQQLQAYLNEKRGLQDKKDLSPKKIITALDFDKSIFKKRKSNQQPPNLSALKLKNGMNLNNKQIYQKIQMRVNKSRNIMTSTSQSQSSTQSLSQKSNEETESQINKAYEHLNRYKKNNLAGHSQTQNNISQQNSPNIQSMKTEPFILPSLKQNISQLSFNNNRISEQNNPLRRSLNSNLNKIEQQQNIKQKNLEYYQSKTNIPTSTSIEVQKLRIPKNIPKPHSGDKMV
ncbi:protein phosphatase 2c containing protein [Stylonychia lemnae]|uniref:Protein phosphatase 2c containing protein n=1 Tax=Stylonychia lemnae TaxID=5949 RepID=A0A078ASI5_STYLE|nr:protein phosphatase 2c containing protein [Stylonychia lemnae]|eukprot:CDW85415.1 protein phosphatase 2c containing protein [Stylonychia lemnae]